MNMVRVCHFHDIAPVNYWTEAGDWDGVGGDGVEPTTRIAEVPADLWSTYCAATAAERKARAAIQTFVDAQHD